MKKSVFVFLVSVLLIIGGMNFLNAQEQPAPKKDTVNMDTDAKPEVFYAIEDEESAKSEKSGNTTTIVLIAGAIIVIGGAAYFLTKKKK